MSKTLDLIKVDMGPYASRLYKYDLFHDEEYRLDTSKGLKFLHFNVGSQGHDQRTFSKRMFHVWQNRTVAVLALSPSGVRQLATDFLALVPGNKLYASMVVGVAFVSRSDNYSRRIGRDEAVKKMEEVDLEIKSVNINSTHIYINLIPYHGVTVTLRLNKNTDFSTIIGELTGKASDRLYDRSKDKK